MCFVLYAGTSRAMRPIEWREDAPDLSVHALSDHESPIAAHFSKPEVQYIGSTSGCGCDFPYVMLPIGEGPSSDDDEGDPESSAIHRRNREGLVALLQATGEQSVELYGVWDGDFRKQPVSREELSLETLLESKFWFKEQGFYVVRIASH